MASVVLFFVCCVCDECMGRLEIVEIMHILDGLIGAKSIFDEQSHVYSSPGEDQNPMGSRMFSLLINSVACNIGSGIGK